jgi:hypothetical protein
MSIKTREDANKYYHLVNELVDEYIDKWKIKPSNLGKYLSPGSSRFQKFLQRNKLSEVSGTDVILKDVIQDRVNMEKDGVLTFESFKFFESDEFKLLSLSDCLTKGMDKADIELEKVLADHFDTNLGHIDIKNPESHLFVIDEGWESGKLEVVIYSESDVELIGENILDFVYNELSKKKISITPGFEVSLSGVFSKEQLLRTGQFNKSVTIDLVSETLGSRFTYDGVVNGCHIWTSEIE